jgi:hypothetical protein
MNKENLEVLNVMHQVLRGVILAIAAGSKANKELVAFTLQTMAAAPDLSDEAKAILLNLAEPFDLISKKN